jgi:hypothetical protein
MPTWLNTLLEKWPDFVINVLGVALGFIGGWWSSSNIAKWQVKKQKEDQERKDFDTLKFLFQRTVLELRDNRNKTENLCRTIELSRNSRKDMWEWVNAIADTYLFDAYYELMKSGTSRLLLTDIQNELFTSYEMIVDLTHMIKQSKAAHSFYLGYAADEDSANMQFNNTKTYATTVFEHLTYAVDIVYKHNNLIKNETR